ncbi:Bug family tripartite tricarboxylate transporter substrate binding protein [Agrobacterium pusense]|uniref:Bug family tripartite tricarboxylate transporter substrate binding protein n=1 Tax=Agrobacterium pusense TaxID=648995 RepID=UPI0028A80616|nr:tripartite tricarboxylate transporter substrate-binding protein [Agrobacterium pusense]
MKFTSVFTGAALFLAMIGGSALAQYPERTIEAVLPSGAGPALSVSQIIADAMGKELGVQLTVLATPGAGGIKAFQTALRKPADGYTIIDGYVAPLVLQPILGKADWKHGDFIPLHAGASNAFAIGWRTDETRWSSFEEMMTWGKANPGKLRYSSGQRNNLPHLVMAKALQSYGVVAQNVPYNSPPAANNDVKSGILDFTFVNVGSYKQDPDALKIGLVLSEQPAAKDAFGGAPSIADIEADLGISGLAPMGWDWWLVKKDTAPERVETLRAAMGKVMKDPDVRSRITRLGFVPLDWDHGDYDKIVSGVHDQLSTMASAMKWEEEALKAAK